MNKIKYAQKVGNYSYYLGLVLLFGALVGFNQDNDGSYFAGIIIVVLLIFSGAKIRSHLKKESLRIVYYMIGITSLNFLFSISIIWSMLIALIRGELLIGLVLLLFSIIFIYPLYFSIKYFSTVE